VDTKVNPKAAPAHIGDHCTPIDGLRALAVAVVIAYHCAAPHLAGGFLALDVFFPISGFVITLTLLREHDQTGRVDKRTFYWRRTFRLMPGLVCMIVFGAVTEIGSGKITARSYLPEAAKAITFTYNLFQAADHARGVDLSHTWSLGIEEQFYLMWAPLLALILARVVDSRRIATVGAIAAFFYVAEVVTGLTLGTQASFYLPWSRFDELLIGAVLALAIHGHQSTRVTRLLANQAVAIAAAIVIGLVVTAHPENHDDALIFVGYVGVSLLTAVVVGHVYVRRGQRASVVSAVLGWTPFVWLGRRSYGIYLYHAPILLPFALLTGRHWLLSFAFTAVATTAVAAFSYRFIERPAMRAGHAWLAQRERGHVVPAR
jgi:peptidoglycan/LPS O-acetylase OafA/YrhL